MASDTSLVFNLLAKDKISPELARVKGSFTSFGRHLKGVALAAAGLFGGIQVAGFLKGAVEEYRDAEKTGRLVNAVIKSTGGIAGITADHVSKLGMKIGALAGVDDDVIASGEQLLLTFTKIGNKGGIFDMATQAMTDMTAALNHGQVTQEGLKGSALMLGRALNDPVRGMMAMRRAGVSFTSEQQKQVAALVKSGHLMEAQKIILKELQTEFGGAAAAATDPVQQASAAWGNLKEVIGGLVFPAVGAFANFMIDKVIPAVTRVAGTVRDLAGWFQIGFIDRVQTAQGAAGFFERLGIIVHAAADVFRTRIIPAVREFVDYMRNKVVPVVQSAATKIGTALVQAFVVIRREIIAHRAQLMQLWAGLKTVADFIVTKVAPVIGPIFVNAIQMGVFWIKVVVRQISFWVDVFNRVKAAATGATALVQQKFGALVGFFKKLPGQISSAASGLWNGLVSSFKAAINHIIGLWNNFHLTLGGGSILGLDIPSVTLNTPDIPYLDRGGLIARTGVAVVHEGERIVPTSTQSRDARPLVINANGLSAKMFEWLREEIAARGGRLAVLGLRVS